MRIGVLVLALLAAACSSGPAPADLILTRGKIVTLNDELGEVEALAARDGLIVAVGRANDLEEFAGPETKVIDLQGRTAVPGFIEGHGHFTGIGRARMNIDLSGETSWEAVVRRIAAAAERTEKGQWILGWGWHQEKWATPPSPAVEGYPVHDALSRVTPDHPVLLKHAAGNHAGMVNAHTMRLADIDPATPDPPGGRILRDAGGNPTGALQETAYGLALAAYDKAQANRTEQELETAANMEIKLADEECLSKGVTSFQDAGSSFRTVDRIRALAERGELGTRLWIMLSEGNDALDARIDAYRLQDVADGQVTVRAIKRSIDGALGSRGAWLLEPYSDLPESTGLNTIPLDELERTARIALEHGFQLCVHAIGDRGNRETLDIYERAFAQAGVAGLRWRIEHAQHLHPTDIPRFAELGLVASMQGVHCTSDGPWVPQRLGARRSAEGAYRWRDLIDRGVIVSNGTDAPVEDVDPIANFHASVTRRTDDDELFHPEQRMTRMEALRSMTVNAAYAAFEEDRKGTLEPGKLADVTVLSRDILEAPDDELPDTQVVYTIVGGRVLFDGTTPVDQRLRPIAPR